MRRYKHLNDKEFYQIKQLIDMGFNAKKVKEITNRSSATIGSIKRSKTLADYYAIIHTYTMKKPALDKAVPNVVSEDSFTPTDPTVAVLTRIAVALEKLEVHWRPKKRAFFS